MSFKQNDNRQMIDLQNYEEYFILYMDGELNDQDRKMVDDFLIANPQLRNEFEAFMGTKLPQETFSFDKNELMASAMKLNTIEEELLLYIDGELPAAQKAALETELTSRPEFRVRHEMLLKAKLDASEQVPFPYKEDLYHHHKVVMFRPWMRAAAAVAIIAVAGILYFAPFKQQNSSEAFANTRSSNTVNPSGEKKVNDVTPSNSNNEMVTSVNNDATPDIQEKKMKTDVASIVRKASVVTTSKDPQIAKMTDEEKKQLARDDHNIPSFEEVKNLQGDVARVKQNPISTIATDNLETDNKIDVTNKNAIRNTIVQDAGQTITKDPVVSNDRKGTLKSFLRKATKVIEKRTGINPVNDDGELLIGMVAVKLK